VSDVDTSSLVAGFQALALQAATNMRDDFVERAKGRCSRRTGAEADSIAGSDPVDAGDGLITWECWVGADYGKYQDEGTGIYGPEGKRITRPGGGPMAFDWPAAGGVVIVMSIAGAPGTHFWTDTVADWPDIVAGA
jgi:hypothetical protein